MLPRIDEEINPSVRLASFSEPPSSLANMFCGLSVLQEISRILLACQHGEFPKERVLFSSLPLVSTVSDCIFRKLRGLMMVVSLDCTKLELLEEVNTNPPMKKSKDKIGAASRRKKGRTRNMKGVNPIPRSTGQDARFDEAVKVSFILFPSHPFWKFRCMFMVMIFRGRCSFNGLEGCSRIKDMSLAILRTLMLWS